MKNTDYEKIIFFILCIIMYWSITTTIIKQEEIINDFDHRLGVLENNTSTCPEITQPIQEPLDRRKMREMYRNTKAL